MKLRMGGYYLHNSGESILKLSIVVTLKNGVKKVSGRFVNHMGEVDEWTGKSDDFLENFTFLPKKIAIDRLMGWGIFSEDVFD